MKSKINHELLEYLGISEDDLDENKFNPNFNEREITIKLIEFLENENQKKI